MFDIVTKNKRLVQIVLAIIILPFAFFGLDFYFRDGGGGSGVATVGKRQISEQEFGIALRTAQDNMQQQARDNPQIRAYLSSPEFKEAVLNDLIQRQVLLRQAASFGMAVADSELQQIIIGIDAFKDPSGKFSPERYQRLLRAQSLTPEGFENQIRQDIMLSRMQSAVSGSAFLPDVVVKRLIRIREQEREVSQIVFSPAQFRDKAKVSPEDAKKYFDEHQEQFQIPERAKLEYVLLTPEVVSHGLKIDDEELRKAYEQRISDFQTQEQRRASHILISVPTGASEEEKSKARAKAQDIYQQLKQAPARFAELAKKMSQDPGSAEQGGDLGSFERGFMVKPFEDAVFSLNVGEISQPVETQYGFHIIRLDALTPVKTTPLEKVKGQLLEELRKSHMQRAFAEAAQRFSDLVYEQYDSLKPVAQTLNLTVQQSDWVGRSGGSMNPILNNPKLLEAVFSAEALEEKRNTEAIEVQPNMLISARVIERKPVTTLAFEDVQKDIVDLLKHQRATELSEAAGRDTLDKLRKGETLKLDWSPARYVSLQRREGLHPEGARAVFGADIAKPPAYAGVSASEGRFVIYRISNVRNVDSVSPEQVQAARRQLSQMVTQEQFQSFLASVRTQADVKINRKRLDGSQ